jgi:hypothetical protein
MNKIRTMRNVFEEAMRNVFEEAMRNGICE